MLTVRRQAEESDFLAVLPINLQLLSPVKRAHEDEQHTQLDIKDKEVIQVLD